MDQVKKYPKDYAKPLLVMMDYFEKVNVRFFNKNKTWFERNWRFFYIVPFMVCHFSGMTVYILKIIVEGKDVFADAFMIPIYVVTVQTFAKTFIMLCNKRDFEHIIDELGQVWRTDELNDLQKATKKSSAKELLLSEYAFMRLPRLVAWQYLLLPVLETLLHNVILGEDDVMRLPFSCSYPFDPTSNQFVYGATYTFQIYCMFVVVYLYLATDFLIITLGSHLSVEFLLLCEDLKHTKPTKLENCDVTEIIHDNGIRMIVKKHQKLLIIAQKLDAAANKMMFMNLMFTTINLTFFGLAALVAKNTADRLSNIITLINVMVLVFIICYFCDKLKTASEGIFIAACENPWHEGDLQYKRILLFIMMRSQKPCYLTSMKYTPITLTTFTTVLSTTWSYFSLMNTMYKNSE